jgi:hypothetical protein
MEDPRPKMTRAKKIGFWAAGILAGLLVIIVALSLLASTLIRPLSGQIREALQRTVAERLGGRIDFETMDVSAFPPQGKLEKVHISLPTQNVSGTAASATAYLKILPLLKGDVQIKGVQVERPDFIVALPETSEPKQEKEEKDIQSTLQDLAGGAFGGLTELGKAKLGLLFSIERGRLSLTKRGKPVFIFEDIQASLDMPPEILKTRISAGSNVWGNLQFRSDIDLARMTGSGRIQVTRLQPHLIADALGGESPSPIGDSLVNAGLNFRIKEFPNLEGDWDVSIPLLTVRRGQNQVPLKVDALRGSFRVGERVTNLTLTELAMGSPRLHLSGAFTEDRRVPSASLEVIGREMDVASLREIALALAGDIPQVKDIFDVARGGKIDQAVATARGTSREEALNPENLDIQGNVSDVQVRIADLSLDVSEVSGGVSFSKGILKGEGLQAKTGNTRASQGSLVLGTEGEDPPFHLDIQLVSDVAEVAEFLGRVVEDKDFLDELKMIKRVEGSAEGRLVLGERLESIRTRVDISKLNLRGEYDKLPQPVEISEGRLTCEGTLLTWSHVNGTVGNTSITQTAGRVDWGEDRIEAAFEQAVGDLDLIHPLLPLIEAAGEKLQGIRSVQGKIHFLASRLEGSLKDLSSWTYHTSGRVEEGKFEARFLPALLSIRSAEFEADLEGIRFRNAEALLGDAAMDRLSGSIEGYRKGDFRCDLLLNGTVGPRINKWLYAITGIPPELEVRAPLTLSDARLAWGEGLETSFSGDVAILDGPELSLDVVIGAQGNDLSLRKLVIAGKDSQASLAMTIENKVMDLTFNGNLTDATLRQILEKPPPRNGWIKGDFSVRVPSDFLQSTVQGVIEAGDLVYDLSPGDPVKVRSLSLKGMGNRVHFESVDLAWRETEMLVQGTVGFSPEGIAVDLSLDFESFTWEKLKQKEKQEQDKKEGEPRQTKPGGIFGPVPVNGAVHMKAKSFEFGDLKWAPFALDLNLKGNRVEVKIDEGRLCGISTEAAVKISPEPRELQAESEAKGQELQPTLSCLLDTKRMSGELDFTGEAAALVQSEDLLRNLHGQFKIDAGEGRIYRYGLVSKILAAVNITEILKGQTPDFKGEGFGYTSARFEGTIENGVIKLKEGSIDAKSMGLGFEGSIDLPTQNLDIIALVAPLKTVDTILWHIPIVGGILGKDFVAIPVKVTGNWSDPAIVPLSPSAVGSKLLGIVQRTLKLPFKLFQPLLGDKDSKDKKTEKMENSEKDETP